MERERCLTFCPCFFSLIVVRWRGQMRPFSINYGLGSHCWHNRNSNIIELLKKQKQGKNGKGSLSYLFLVETTFYFSRGAKVLSTISIRGLKHKTLQKRCVSNYLKNKSQMKVKMGSPFLLTLFSQHQLAFTVSIGVKVVTLPYSICGWRCGACQVL